MLAVYSCSLSLKTFLYERVIFMRKPEAFLVIGMIFVNLKAMHIKPLKVLIVDDYIKRIEERLSKAKKNPISYKNECELIKTQLLNLPHDIGYELALRCVYTTENFPLPLMIGLTDRLYQKAFSDNNFLYAQLFLDIYNYVSVPQFGGIPLPLTKHKRLFLKLFERKDTKGIERLLSYGANPNGAGPIDSFLSLAVKNNLYNMTELLVKYGASVNPEYGHHPLYYAALEGDKRMVRFLLRKGSLVSSKYLAGAEHSIMQRFTFFIWRNDPENKYANAIELLNSFT